MIYHTVLACATLLNLSMTTKVEMQHLLPQAASYCLENPKGRLSVAYGPIEKAQPTGLKWGRDSFDARATAHQAFATAPRRAP